MTDPDLPITPIKDLGLDLVVVGTFISCLGVLYNNLILDHIAAMEIWVISNLLFAVFFYGRYKKWWDGCLSDLLMCLMYLFMLGSGVWGLWQSGVFG